MPELLCLSCQRHVTPEGAALHATECPGVPETTDPERLQRHLDDIRRTLRSYCRVYGDNEWSDRLHLSDVIDKHLMRPLLGALGEAEGALQGIDKLAFNVSLGSQKPAGALKEIALLAERGLEAIPCPGEDEDDD